MELLANEKINDIRKSADIVEIISNYIPLAAHGKNYFGVCPFHDDKNPSMSVSKDKQIYKCFACGEKGNIFTFVQKYENVSFLEAVKIVANKIGQDIEINTKTKVQNNYKELYEMYELSLKLYQNNISSKQGIEAKEYLTRRHIDDDIIKEFEIGLSVKDHILLTNLFINKKYSYEDMLKTGLIVKNEYGYNDIYYNRVMFPLCDVTGKIVGYSGRVYNDEKTSKYINTKETEIFKKGELLYNYHRAKDDARIKDTIIVMEGFMDVIRAYTIGVKNVIATMGTAVTKSQALLMRRLAKNVILCFDGDEAGEKATEACSKELIKIGITPKVVRLEEDLDPDEYIIKYGENRFKDKIDNPMSIMDFKLGHYKKGKNLNQSTDKAEYIKNIINELSSIDDEILREVTLTKISEEAKIDINILRENLNKKEVKVVEIQKKEPIIKMNKYEKAEKYLIYYMVNSPDVIKIYDSKVKYLPTDKCRSLARIISRFYKENHYINVADLITEINNDEVIMNTLDEIINLNLKDDYSLEEIEDYVKTLEDYSIKEEIKRLNDQLLNEKDMEKQIELLKKIVELRGDIND